MVSAKQEFTIKLGLSNIHTRNQEGIAGLSDEWVNLVMQYLPSFKGKITPKWEECLMPRRRKSILVEDYNCK